MLLKFVTPPIVVIPVALLPAADGANPDWAVSEGAQSATAWNHSSTDAAAGSTSPFDLHHGSGGSRREPISASANSLTAFLATVSWKSWITAAWLLGTLACVCLTLGRVVRFRNILKAAKPASALLVEEARGLCRAVGLKRCPSLVVLEERVSPFIWPFSWPATIVLPARLLDRLDVDSRRAILAHELVHARRNDHLVRLLELAATALFWWHPLLWLSRRHLREAEERCADAEVVGRLPDARRSYALALLETVAFLSSARRSLPVAATGAEPAAPLKGRIAAILTMAPARRVAMHYIMAACAVAVAVLPLGIVAAKPRADGDRGAILAFKIEPGDRDSVDRTRQVAEISEGQQDEQPPIGDDARSLAIGAGSQPDSSFLDDVAFQADVPVKKLNVGARLPFGNRWQELTEVPRPLVGLNYGMRGGYEGIARFRVTRDQTVYLAMHNDEWGGGGNSSGGWKEEVVSRGELESQGWRRIGELQFVDRQRDKQTNWLVFVKECGAGESYAIRNHKYHAPIVIWGESGDK